jgi:signal transduction histidine kinase
MAASDDAEQRDKYVEQIQRQFDLLTGMTREVLAFARGDTDLVVRKVYVNRFIEELTTQLGAATAGRGIDFEVEARYDGVAYFDEQKLLRVFHNLASNAIDAMPEGGHLKVKVELDSDMLVWSVKDTGPGIPPKVHARMFELFATGKKGGTGLGLAIVKRIIEDHRGSIRCDTGSSGTTFVIQLPMQRPED